MRDESVRVVVDPLFVDRLVGHYIDTVQSLTRDVERDCKAKALATVQM
jgi:hypothetical protein